MDRMIVTLEELEEMIEKLPENVILSVEFTEEEDGE